jgi:hypothetical protein
MGMLALNIGRTSLGTSVFGLKFELKTRNYKGVKISTEIHFFANIKIQLDMNPGTGHSGWWLNANLVFCFGPNLLL